MLRSGAIAGLAVVAAILLQHDVLPSGKTGMVPVRANGHILHVAQFEVTVAQWQDCVDAGACDNISPKVKSPQITPMTGVNWFDVAAYVAWYNSSHANHVRLPTAAEWRLFSRKPEPLPRKPLFDDPRLAWAAQYGQEESPGGPVRSQGSWPRTADGLSDIGGNVWEWTSSCARNDAGISDVSHCPAMKVMGAHMATLSVFVRDPASGGCATGKPPAHVGFRLVADSN